MQLSIFFFAIRNDSPGIFACRPPEDKFFERQPIHNITYFNESQAFLKKNLKIFRFFSIFCAFAPEKSFFPLPSSVNARKPNETTHSSRRSLFLPTYTRTRKSYNMLFQTTIRHGFPPTRTPRQTPMRFFQKYIKYRQFFVDELKINRIIFII